MKNYFMFNKKSCNKTYRENVYISNELLVPEDDFETIHRLKFYQSPLSNFLNDKNVF